MSGCQNIEMAMDKLSLNEIVHGCEMHHRHIAHIIDCTIEGSASINSRHFVPQVHFHLLLCFDMIIGFVAANVTGARKKC